MAGMRGNLARLIPDYGWRMIMGLVTRPARSNKCIEDLRADQIADFSSMPWGLEFNVEDSYGVIYRTPDESDLLRKRLVDAGVRVVPLPSEAHSANVLRGWACAPRTVCGRRTDLVEAVGFRIFETVDALAPVLQNSLDFRSPVDLVYTWVDGSDEQWRSAKLAATSGTLAAELPTATDDARFFSNDELKYSLRSVESFLPWVNHIYIVTAGHKPSWINENHPRITVVHHEEIFGEISNLPTFNSHAIESQLHHIPGLSEHFVYVNDDVFFGPSIPPDLFFTSSGLARFQLSERHYANDSANGLPVNVAARNNAEVMQQRFGVNSTLKFKHVAHAQRRSVLEAIETENPDEFSITAASRFRSADDISIPSSLAHYYGLALGKAVPGTASYKYVDVGSRTAQMELTKVLWDRRPQMICLNQVSGQGQDLEAQSKMLKQFLERAYPWPSSMELGYSGNRG